MRTLTFGKIISSSVLTFFSLVLSTNHSFAYIGPGTGLTAIGSILAFLFAAVFALIGFVWYPIKRLRRWLAEKRSENTEEE
jgi:uncharacterized membrane protein